MDIDLYVSNTFYFVENYHIFVGIISLTFIMDSSILNCLQKNIYLFIYFNQYYSLNIPKKKAIEK